MQHRRILPALTLLLAGLHPTAPAQDADRAARIAQELLAMQPEIDAAIERGTRYLVEQQLLDGTWDFATGMYPSGQTALCVYTLLEGHLSLEHAAVQRGLAAMLARPPGETYSAACQMLALDATGDPTWRPAMERVVDVLLDWQVKGLWSYPGVPGAGSWDKGRGVVDLSNTQFALLGLRMAHLAGIDVPQRAYQRTIDAMPKLLGWTRERGSGRRAAGGVTGFRYEEAYRFPPTGSMTAGGIGVLKIALDGLGERARKRDREEVLELIEGAMGWLDEHWSIVTNPVEGGALGGGAGPGESWHLYYLYALERLGAFLDTETIGEHHWYHSGARHLLAIQEEDGHWGERHDDGGPMEVANRDLPDTCFAILFLARASHGGATLSGPSKVSAHVMDDTGSDVRFRATGDNPLSIWIDGLAPRIVTLYGEGPVVRGLRVARVEYLVDGEVAHAADGDPARPWTPERRFQHRLRFSRPGPRELRVRVGLVAPDADRARLTPDHWIESFPITVDVREAVEPWMIELAELPMRNLLPRARARIAASSHEDEASRAEHAADGRYATRWLSSGADDAPWMRLELGRPQTADTLLVCSGARRPPEAGGLARVTRVRLRVNDAEEWTEHTLDEDPLRPSVLPLPDLEPIRTLDLAVTGIDRSHTSRGRVGFAELSLERRHPPVPDEER